MHSTYINNSGISGHFEINNDIIEVYSPSVNLDIDLSGATHMRFGNTPAARDSSAWEAYVPNKSWMLSAGEGKKTVYGSFRNSSLDSIHISDDIIYTVSPTLPYATGLTLWLDAHDAASISSTAGEVLQWNDKSGNNYHAVQNTSSSQPNLLTNEIDFNGASEYFYLEDLHYTNVSPLDGLLVCGVFKTDHVSSTYNDNWSLLDFDRSEWFDFYNKGGDYGFSFDSDGTIRDITTSGLTMNDNKWHIACASYDNTQTNDTIISVNGNTEYSANLEPTGAQIGVSQLTRYGFVGDGSEAATENAGRNNVYYDGSIGEMLYFDTPISSGNRKDIECYLGAKWGIGVNGCPENIEPIAHVVYSPERTTSSNILAKLDGYSENITITNNGGSPLYNFTENGIFTFEYVDAYGNAGATVAQVDWIDPSAPGIISTEYLNEAPLITSYSGASIHTIEVGSGVTELANISAVDTVYNVIGEYGKSTLSGNTWKQINHYEMCSPVVNISHRQDVNGEIQRAPRVRNKQGTHFEVHVDNYNSTIGSIPTGIDYVVMNAGIHTFSGGLLINAGSQMTSSVACSTSTSPFPTAITFGTPFSLPPVVTHTVSTENDSTWVTSGVNANNGVRNDEPLMSGMGTLLQRSFNSCIHSAEDVDFIAFEPGNYTLPDGTILDAIRSSDSVSAITAFGSPINFGVPFSATPNTVLVSQLGEDGGNGGYAQIHSAGGVSSTVVNATIDEDGPGADRGHTTEVVSSLAFDKSSGYFWKDNTLTYSIVGGADSADFTINSSNGKLDFRSGKSPNNYTDSDTDGVYEVIISVCDSHCNSACTTQTIRADTRETTPPIISSINHASGSLLPGGNHDITFYYSDGAGGSGIDTDSSIIVLQKWNGIDWGSDISNIGFSTGTLNSTQGNFPTNNLSYGKYKTTFTIDDFSGNTSGSYESIFYIDTPEFHVSTAEIDIGTLSPLSPSFSSEVLISVKTVGAGFSVIMNRNTDLHYESATLSSWNGNTGYGIDTKIYTNTINTIQLNQNLATQVPLIDPNGELQTYTYALKIAGDIDIEQAAGDYTGSLDFGIQFHY